MKALRLIMLFVYLSFFTALKIRKDSQMAHAALSRDNITPKKIVIATDIINNPGNHKLGQEYYQKMTEQIAGINTNKTIIVADIINNGGYSNQYQGFNKNSEGKTIIIADTINNGQNKKMNKEIPMNKPVEEERKEDFVEEQPEIKPQKEVGPDDYSELDEETKNYLEDGIFYFHPYLNTDYAIQSASYYMSAKIVVNPMRKSLDQEFKLQSHEGFFAVFAQYSEGLVWNVEWDAHNNGDDIMQYELHGYPSNELFKFLLAPGEKKDGLYGPFYIEPGNDLQTRFLGVQNVSENAHLKAIDFTPGENHDFQKWYLERKV